MLGWFSSSLIDQCHLRGSACLSQRLLNRLPRNSLREALVHIAVDLDLGLSGLLSHGLVVPEIFSCSNSPAGSTLTSSVSSAIGKTPLKGICISIPKGAPRRMKSGRTPSGSAASSPHCSHKSALSGLLNSQFSFMTVGRSWILTRLSLRASFRAVKVSSWNSATSMALGWDSRNSSHISASFRPTPANWVKRFTFLAGFLIPPTAKWLCSSLRPFSGFSLALLGMSSSSMLSILKAIEAARFDAGVLEVSPASFFSSFSSQAFWSWLTSWDFVSTLYLHHSRLRVLFHTFTTTETSHGLLCWRAPFSLSWPGALPQLPASPTPSQTPHSQAGSPTLTKEGLYDVGTRSPGPRTAMLQLLRKSN